MNSNCLGDPSKNIKPSSTWHEFHNSSYDIWVGLTLLCLVAYLWVDEIEDSYRGCAILIISLFYDEPERKKRAGKDTKLWVAGFVS